MNVVPAADDADRRRRAGAVDVVVMQAEAGGAHGRGPRESWPLGGGRREHGDAGRRRGAGGVEQDRLPARGCGLVARGVDGDDGVDVGARRRQAGIAPAVAAAVGHGRADPRDAAVDVVVVDARARVGRRRERDRRRRRDGLETGRRPGAARIGVVDAHARDAAPGRVRRSIGRERLELVEAVGHGRRVERVAERRARERRPEHRVGAARALRPVAVLHREGARIGARRRERERAADDLAARDARERDDRRGVVDGDGHRRARGGVAGGVGHDGVQADRPLERTGVPSRVVGRAVGVGLDRLPERAVEELEDDRGRARARCWTRSRSGRCRPRAAARPRSGR